MTEERVKCGRITKGQKKRLLELMKADQRVACGQFFGPDSNKKAEAVWKSVAEELNATGGANKSWEKWRKCWANWKMIVKKQYGAQKRHQNRTGNLPAADGPKPVEGMDLEVLNFFEKDLVEGDQCTEEMGVVAPTCHNFLEVEYLDEADVEDTSNVEEAVGGDMQASKTGKRCNCAKGSYYSVIKEMKTEFEAKDKKRSKEISELTTEIRNISAKLDTIVDLLSKKNIT